MPYQDTHSIQLTAASYQCVGRNHNPGNNPYKFTVATWVKRTTGSYTQVIAGFGDNNNWSMQIMFHPTNGIWVRGAYHYWYEIGGGQREAVVVPEWQVLTVEPTGLIGDGNWHHVTVAVDTTQAVPSDRVKVFIDNAFVAMWSDCLYPTQNYQALRGGIWFIGRGNGCIGESDYLGIYPLDAKLNEFYFIDNAYLDPSWFVTGTPGGPKPYECYLGYGQAGFYLDFEENNYPDAMGLDRSGHGYHFSVINSPTWSTDTPAIALYPLSFNTSSPILGTAAFRIPGSLEAGSPVLGRPIMIQHGVNRLDPNNLSVMNPKFETPNFLAYNMVNLGPYWNQIGGVIGGPFMDSRGFYKAIAILDRPLPTGSGGIAQQIEKDTASHVYRFSAEIAPTAEKGQKFEIGLTDTFVVTSAVFDPETGECLQRNSYTTATYGGGEHPPPPQFKLLDVAAEPLRYGYYRYVILCESGTSDLMTAFIRLVKFENGEWVYDYDGNYFGSIFVANPILCLGNDTREFRWEIGAPEMRFYWTVHLAEIGLQWFRCGQGELGVDTHLKFMSAVDLECVLRRWQPAQDDLVFDYSGSHLAGESDPMAGTP